ncbi:MAG: hypothetical protein HY929_01655 [Euryarchaeota archaeon]|nr:hypothetical protein [Euryarchaeota archaeon]
MVLYHLPELWTFTLNQNGLLEKQDCMLYTLPYHDEIVYVTTRTGRTIAVTKNHPFLVNRFGRIIWKKAEELTLNDYLVCPAKLPDGDEKFELMDHEEALNRLCTKFIVVKLEDIKELRDKTKNFTNFYNLTGVDFDKLRIALGFSKIELLKKLGLERSEYWKLIKFLRGGKNERINCLLTNYFKENHPKCEYDFIESYKITRMKRFNVDEDFIFWIAFLLSDGSISENYVAAYQKNYPKALDRFIELTVNKLGINISEVISEPDGRTVIIRSKPLVEYLKLRFDTAPGKGIPPWMLSLPANLRREFLRTFISLESSNRDNRITFSQVNKDSVNVIIHMLIKEGILTWIKDQKRIFRLKIQGRDYYAFLKKIGWIEQFKIDLSKQSSRYSNFRAVPIPRQLVLELVKLLGLINFRSYGTKKFLSRTWYGSYNSIKEGRERISEYFYKVMLEDLRKEIDFRRTLDVETLAQTDPHRLAILCGLSITEISREANFSKHTVWQLYTNGTSHIELKNFIKEKFKQRLSKAEKILAYLQGLLTEDIYYDKVHKIEYKPYSGLVFGLVVPGLQNYLAGFGACGINHNTYPLPEAQLDRFLLKVLVDYPTEEEEDKIVEMYASHSAPAIQKIIDKETLLSLQRLTRQMPIAEDIKKHALDIVTSTRSKDFATKIEYGASPRASIGLVLTSKARALIRGKNFVSKEDINAMAYPILRHRIILTFDAERKGITQDAVVNEIIQKL